MLSPCLKSRTLAKSVAILQHQIKERYDVNLTLVQPQGLIPSGSGSEQITHISLFFYSAFFKCCFCYYFSLSLAAKKAKWKKLSARLALSKFWRLLAKIPETTSSKTGKKFLNARKLEFATHFANADFFIVFIKDLLYLSLE
jgi:hypothetical protein